MMSVPDRRAANAAARSLPQARLPRPSLLGGWVSKLTTHLNAALPSEFIALDAVSINGSGVDAGIQEENEAATVPAVYAPTSSTGTAQYEFPDTIEVRIENEETRQLVGAVELISPGNKDRGAKRDMFLAKCLDYLAGGACVVIVDVITERRANLHNEIVATLGAYALALADDAHLYAATYRPIIRKKKMNVDVWVNPLQIGAVLPTMPLRVVAGLFVPVELEETYAAACRGRKLIV